MAKGFYSQGVVVLFDAAPSLDALEAALPVPVRKRVAESTAWEFSGPSLVVDTDPERNGLVAIDVVDRPWPDDMGSPVENPTLFGAWAMGQFGPFAYPAGLERACQHAYHWPHSPREVVASHRAFVRLRLSYVFGLPETAVIPEGVDPVRELDQLLALARAVLTVRGARLLFVPGAELLFDLALLELHLDDATRGQRPPIDVWSNVRIFRIDTATLLMDTAGLAAVDRFDLEAIVPDQIQPSEVAGFLRNLSLYLLEKGNVFRVGNTMGGPGGRWVVLEQFESKSTPPRTVVRIAPEDTPVPAALREA